MELTIVIPTNREPSQYVQKVIENINSFPIRTTREIVVVSQEEVKGEGVRWIKEPSRLGPINCFNLAVDSSDSEYFIFMVDDHVFLNDPSHGVDFLRYQCGHRKFPIASLTPGFPCYNPIQGQVLGSSPIDFPVGRYPLCRFPIFHRSVLDKLGGKIFHPSLFYHAADILLGYYLGKMGEPSIDCNVFVRPHNPAKDPTFEVNDCEIVKSIIREYENGKESYL